MKYAVETDLVAMKKYGERRYNSVILDLGTRWRLVVSFTPFPI
jgi:hypothetical protein